MTDKIVLFTTVATIEEAERLARTLLDRRLAACVNLLPAVQSIYRWEGKIESASEILLVIKSRRALFEGIRDVVQSLHSYAVPELIAVPVVDGYAPYLNWIDQETEVQ
jgi:periplasmic divalent cation tolerance protein